MGTVFSFAVNAEVFVNTGCKAIHRVKGGHKTSAAVAASSLKCKIGSGGASAAQSWTRDQIGQMSQAEFERNEAEIMRAMREGRIRDS